MRCVRPWFHRMVLETRFLETYPHFTPELARIDPVEDDTCFMAVSRGRGDRVRLHVNTAAFAGRPAEFRAVLQHELHHVIAGHLDDAYRNVPEPVILQVAKEIVANEYIVEPLPGNPARWQDYAKYGVGAGQATWRRYELLLEAYRKGDYQPPPAIRVRCCEAEDGDGEHARLPQSVRRAMERAGLFDRDPAEVEVGGATERSAIDWVRELHRFARSRAERRQSLRRPSRRDPSGQRIGEVPGWSRRPVRSRLIVAIDTSKSMSTGLFPRIAGELQSMMRHADLVIVECDRRIHREYPFRGELQTVQGRGGTDLRPVFAPDVIARHAADGVVYFTDGEGEFLATAPPVKTLWVLSGDEGFQCPWGSRVHMDVG